MTAPFAALRHEWLKFQSYVGISLADIQPVCRLAALLYISQVCDLWRRLWFASMIGHGVCGFYYWSASGRAAAARRRPV